MRVDFVDNKRLENAMMTSVDLQRVTYFLLVPVSRTQFSLGGCKRIPVNVVPDHLQRQLDPS